ncbi:hypothetical protein EV424DRAFT_1544734 [Suillus variegatus]|nr:hypothetical protein EV424DRAFT_1544734 [Suillus variegatus]
MLSSPEDKQALNQGSSKSDNKKSKSKKKKSSANPREELYIAAARCITRCIDRFCKIDKVIDIDTLLKRHELADAGQLSEDEDDIAHRENQLAELSQKMRDRFHRNYKRLLELALGLKARSNDSTGLKIQIGKYAALDPAKKLHPRTGLSTALGSQSRGARPCNAVLHDMNTVEAAHIVYGCVQPSYARFGLGAQNIWTEEDGDFKYRDLYRNIVELIEDLPNGNCSTMTTDVMWQETTLKTALSSTREGGSDLACLRAQMAARNAAAKTDTTYLERPAAPPTVAHPPSALRTPPPSSPACILSTPRPVQRPAKTPHLHQRATFRYLQPRLSRIPAKTVLDSQANGGASGSELTKSDEEEPQRKRKAPAKRKGKSKAVETSGDESVPSTALTQRGSR